MGQISVGETVSGRNLVRDIPLAFTEADFFKVLLTSGSNLEKLKRHYPSLDIASIDSVEYKDPPSTGLIERTKLKRITFRGHDGRSLPLELLLKVAEQGTFRKGDIGYRHHKRVMSSMDYQKRQMEFWNSIGLRAPLVFGLMEHGGNPLLFMEFLDGNSHDLNVIALKEARRTLDTIDLTSDNENKVDSHRKALADEENSIVNSSIDVVRMFHLHGTRELKQLNRLKTVLETYQPRDVEEYYLIQRGKHYFGRLLELFAKGKVLDDPKFKQEDISRLVAEFSQLLRPFIGPFADLDKLVYAQGDEYLHHLQYSNRNGERDSVMFDADHVMLTRPEYSYAKLLTSYLLALTYEREYSFLEQAFFPPHDHGYPSHKNTSKVIRDYSYIAIFNRLCDMGRRASDDIVNSATSVRFARRGFIYNPIKVRFPVSDHIPQLVTYPSVKESILIQREQLADRLSHLASDSKFFGREDRSNADNLRRFLTDYGII